MRDAAKDMTVALQRIVGTAALETHLTVLRPKQKDEYLAAFNGGGALGAGGGAGRGGEESARKAHQQHSSSSTPHNHVMHSPGGKVNTSADRARDPHRDARDSMDTSMEDFSTCSFCGAVDKGE